MIAYFYGKLRKPFVFTDKNYGFELANIYATF